MSEMGFLTLKSSYPGLQKSISGLSRKSYGSKATKSAQVIAYFSQLLESID